MNGKKAGISFYQKKINELKVLLNTTRLETYDLLVIQEQLELYELRLDQLKRRIRMLT